MNTTNNTGVNGSVTESSFVVVDSLGCVQHGAWADESDARYFLQSMADGWDKYGAVVRVRPYLYHQTLGRLTYDGRAA